MADLSELDELATMVAVLDAAVRGHQAVVATADAFSRRHIESEEEVAAVRRPLALPMGSNAPPRRSHRLAGAKREVVVAEVVEW